MNILKEVITVTGYTVQFMLNACSAGLIVHCFYDKAVKITRTKLIVIFGINLAAALMSCLTADQEAHNTIIIVMTFLAPMIIIASFNGKRFLGTAAAFLRLIVTELFIIIAAGQFVSNILSAFGVPESQVDAFGNTDLAIVPFSILPLLICILLYIYCIRKGMVLRLRSTEKTLVAIYCIALFATTAATGDGTARRMLDIFTVFLIIIMPILIYKNRLSAYYSEQSAHNESFLEAELAASRQYREAQEETRAFRHDIKNELTMLSVLMREKQYDEAERSLNDMLGMVSELSPRIVTGDDMLDSLISSKLHDLEQHGIEVTVKGVLEGGLDWKPIDICSVFANAIDNAAESCMKLPQGNKRYIHINFRKTEMQRLITIKNPTAEDVDAEALNSGRYNTSKPDKEHHGFGVRNIRKTVEKYGGMLSFACEDKEFTLTIMLMK